MPEVGIVCNDIVRVDSSYRWKQLHLKKTKKHIWIGIINSIVKNYRGNLKWKSTISHF